MAWGSQNIALFVLAAVLAGYTASLNAQTVSDGDTINYQTLKTEALCLYANYYGTFVRVAHEVLDLDFDGVNVNGYVLEMEQGGHTFYLLVMRRADPKA